MISRISAAGLELSSKFQGVVCVVYILCAAYVRVRACVYINIMCGSGYGNY